MTKVLNVLESFLNLHGIRYLRLDGSTKTEERQRIVERFNTDSRIFCMILTTRAGGVGLNLTGADSVIFYDTDYNPAIDAQAQDRVHRIGQKKPVHIYRLVSEKTVEENILRRANEKRTLESIVISQAGFDIDSIRKRAGLDELVHHHAVEKKIKLSEDVALKLKKTTADPRQLTADVSSSKNPGPSTSYPSLAKPRQGSNQGGAKPVQLLSSFGGFAPLSWTENRAKQNQVPSLNAKKSSEKENIRMLAEESDVYHALVADEDGETAATHGSQDADNEFADPDNVGGSCQPSKPKHVNLVSFVKVENSLNPVQRLALKFFQSGLEKSETTSDGRLVAVNISVTETENVEQSKVPYTPLAEEEEEEDFFYEHALTPTAHLSCLKALTDTDANIKLYLPLRDGGPEELNISTVVNGTAAAGLECAEDAAFFPHAYNRMSRTIHATKRQKEKAAFNLRRREEMEAKKLREAKTVVVQRSSSIQRNAGPSSSGELPRGLGPRQREELSNVGQPVAKRLKVESSLGVSGSQVSGSQGGDGLFPGTNGLFKKNVKRNQRKVSSRYNKACLTNASGTSQLGEGIGKNDGWTKQEEQCLIDLVARYSGNMAIVADVLNMQPEVISGNRRKRSIKQCCDRWFNSILKEHKNGQAKPTSNASDDELRKRNLQFFVASAGKATSLYRTTENKTVQSSDVHKSHARATAEAQRNTSTRIDASVPPTFECTNPKIVVPAGHIAGFKAHECTPHAVHKRKHPFLRPLGDSFSPIISRRPSPTSSHQPNSNLGRAAQTPTSHGLGRSQPPRPPNRTQSGAAGISSAHNRVPNARSAAQNSTKANSLQKTLTSNQQAHNVINNRSKTQGVASMNSQGSVARYGTVLGARTTAVQLANAAHAIRRPPVIPNVPNGHVATQAAAVRSTVPAHTAPAQLSSTKLAANSAGSHRRFTAPGVRHVPDSTVKSMTTPGTNRGAIPKTVPQAAVPSVSRLQSQNQVNSNVTTATRPEAKPLIVGNRNFARPSPQSGAPSGTLHGVSSHVGGGLTAPRVASTVKHVQGNRVGVTSSMHCAALTPSNPSQRVASSVVSPSPVVKSALHSKAVSGANTTAKVDGSMGGRTSTSTEKLKGISTATAIGVQGQAIPKVESEVANRSATSNENGMKLQVSASKTILLEKSEDQKAPSQ